MSRGFDQLRIVSSESDTTRQASFLELWKNQLALGTLKRYLLALKRLIFESIVRAPDEPETLR